MSRNWFDNREAFQSVILSRLGELLVIFTSRGTLATSFQILRRISVGSSPKRENSVGVAGVSMLGVVLQVPRNVDMPPIIHDFVCILFLLDVNKAHASSRLGW
jgi:hypothetical protein